MDIQALLLEKALRDAQSGPTMAEIVGGGATVGSALGALSGTMGAPAFIGPARPAGKDDLVDSIRQARINIPGRGRRMAVNTLMGAITGGALGAGTKAMFLNGMPNQAANVLAKMQTTPEGQLTEADQLQLRAILRDIYSGR